MDALARAGHRVELVSTFRSYDSEGDAGRQAALRDQGTALGRRLAEQWLGSSAETRPELWFTYHLYYKAPDWLGPVASSALGIPYVVAEPSHAGKRAQGPWALGHEGAAAAIRQAALLLCPIADDVEGLLQLGAARERVHTLAPFLDPAPFRAASGERAAHRARLAGLHGLDPSVPWIAVAAMMRPGDKLASLRQLAGALARLDDLPWRLVVAGDGDARAEVEAAFATRIPGRAVLPGALALGEIAGLYAAADLCVWPAVNEAYGMALLEAQAAGLPVVASAVRGVPDVVMDGRTGLLAPAGDEAKLAALARQLLTDSGRRQRLGAAAQAFVTEERSIDAAAARLRALLAPLRRASALN
ncbi:MAG TPA: glycosyltransferase family 4 protein [Burkholderiales bacterium]|jgi:glycosyltransferase involved in cell wall biosynthesis|nr:glycosyltransferase family 4 protein [Burkholderiales bacterium]